MEKREASNREEEFKATPLNKKELAVLLGVSPFILRRFLKEAEAHIGIIKGRLASTFQVKYMVDHYGIPKR